MEKIKLTGDEQLGATILYNALEIPFRKILSNAGLEPGRYIKEIEETLDKNFGLNVLNGKLKDLIVAGEIDPAKVTKSAIENAVSVTISIITTDALVADEPEVEKADSHAGHDHGGMGGMGGMM